MGSAITVVIGHRGAGKTTFLKNHLRLHPEVRGYDLDAEIERRSGQPLARILARSESEFRTLERETLNALVRENPSGQVMIALGAGFEGPLPDGVHVLWLRRPSDSLGRVFLNRPRLDQSLSAFDEYRERFLIRDHRFREWAREELTLPEGEEAGDFLVPEFAFDLTLQSENFRDWPQFWTRRRNWPVRFFELRDDLLTAEQIAQARQDIPSSQILFSCRREGRAAHGAYDWPLEMGSPRGQPAILSLHEGDWSKLQGSALLKLAVEIENFIELERGHRWWLEDPQHRAFLPRSRDGRWQWYRSLFGPRMPIHYLREGDGSSLDQPWVVASALQRRLEKNFGAVLGDPVAHSRSPMEHRENGPFVAIQVRESEWTEALPVLTRLGLNRAAVTAPLKRLAGELTGAQVANTLWLEKDRWHGANTDETGLRELDLPQAKDIWVWGQGAMLESIYKVWPHAQAFSARAGTTAAGQPDILIWATGRSRPFQWPPATCRPKLVLDLNYGDDSPGLEYAAREGLPYQSGLKLFKLQAAAQKRLWKGKL
jgi:shikimate 5-dehydrogenase/shikimate kinase